MLEDGDVSRFYLEFMDDLRTLMQLAPNEPILVPEAGRWYVATPRQAPSAHRLLSQGVIEPAHGMPDGWYRLRITRAGEVAA